MNPEEFRKLIEAIRAAFSDQGKIGGEIRARLQKAEENFVRGISAAERAESARAAGDLKGAERALSESMHELRKMVDDFERIGFDGEVAGRVTRDGLEEAGFSLEGKLIREAEIPLPKTYPITKPVPLPEPRWVRQKGPERTVVGEIRDPETDAVVFVLEVHPQYPSSMARWDVYETSAGKKAGEPLESGISISETKARADAKAAAERIEGRARAEEQRFGLPTPPRPPAPPPKAPSTGGELVSEDELYEIARANVETEADWLGLRETETYRQRIDMEREQLLRSGEYRLDEKLTDRIDELAREERSRMSRGYTTKPLTGREILQAQQIAEREAIWERLQAEGKIPKTSRLTGHTDAEEAILNAEGRRVLGRDWTSVERPGVGPALTPAERAQWHVEKGIGSMRSVGDLTLTVSESGTWAVAEADTGRVLKAGRASSAEAGMRAANDAAADLLYEGVVPAKGMEIVERGAPPGLVSQWSRGMSTAGRPQVSTRAARGGSIIAEEVRPGEWKWGIYDENGTLVREGKASSQFEAQRAAELDAANEGWEAATRPGERAVRPSTAPSLELEWTQPSGISATTPSRAKLKRGALAEVSPTIIYPDGSAAWGGDIIHPGGETFTNVPGSFPTREAAQKAAENLAEKLGLK